MGEPERRETRPDPLIDEVRAIRKELSERFGNDVDQLCDYLREIEAKHKRGLADRKAVQQEPAERKG